MDYNTDMKKCDLKFSIPVSFLKEGNIFIAYTPALDLSTSGKTFEEARVHFEEAVNLFFEEIVEKGTLEEVLLDLGWKRKDDNFVPPLAVSHQIESFCIPTAPQ